ncbi:MAG: histidine phosphatase family protein [Rhodospirillaceae bacterium]|nr:histidine phosphatase family protein [Rhodospirillaceae bacterium]
MTRLVMIRHATTSWNEARRLQGHSDIALSAKGRAEVAGWRLPGEYRDGTWITSPLLRAVQTARALGALQIRCEPRLVEMDWGEWEGRTLQELRLNDPEQMSEVEARGLDFSAPGGESPRQLQDRLAPWLSTIAAAGQPVNAVCHKGVVRALFARAAGWDMLGRPPLKLDWSAAQIFRLDGDGTPHLEQSNVSLCRREAAP